MEDARTRTVTSRDIAREVGVTQPTVSRALRGDPRVAAETAMRVQEAARRLGYVPHAAARSLNTRRTGNVAIVVAELDNPFYPELLAPLHQELRGRGLNAVLLSEPTQGVGDSLISLLRSELVDGAIVATATIDEQTRELLRRTAAPIVLLIRDVPGSERDAVVADNEGGAALAARHLLELGHRRIGSIMGPSDTSTARARAAGFEAELDDRVTRHERSGPFSHESGRLACLELLAERQPPTAIFCGNDAIALGALDGAKEAGVVVPDQLSVIGFDDMALAAWASFRLTTIRQPLAEMAAAAAGMLATALDAPRGEPSGAPRRLVLPTKLIERATTAPPGD